ncbi:ABC transporter substrate-binding protein [Rhodoplanes sp. Z2-YC6860]|uniref:ABC transporter substrate-binding protein n=1 Tax=Rhodoplanes sp. Z2-YC6860 TaxID=674703 RepID=UPI00082D3FC0|nr:ABC transporter substrate-binding protein [Rhodoplanes sp. Z2-YC6860]
MLKRRDFIATMGAALAAGTPVLAPLPAQAQGKPGLTPGRGVVSAPGLSFSALYIAKRQDYWSANGVDYSLKTVQGGPLAMAALTAGEADFACIASSDPLIAWDKGIKTLAIAAFTSGVAMQMAARNDWMAKLGVTPASTTADKVKALKEARIGVSTIGGGPAQFMKYVATLYGIEERDFKLLAVGFGAARVAALRENQVDVIVGSAPDADEVALLGFGDFYLSFAVDIPAFKDFPYTILAVTPDFANAQPKAVHAIAKSIGQANDFIQSKFGDTLDILKAEFPKIDGRAIVRSMERDRATFPRGGLMSQSMWENGIKVAKNMKTVKNTPPAAEGEFWTNKFLT